MQMHFNWNERPIFTAVGWGNNSVTATTVPGVAPVFMNCLAKPRLEIEGPPRLKGPPWLEGLLQVYK